MLTTSVLPVATVESTVATIEIKDTVAIVYLNNLCEERRKTKKKNPPSPQNQIKSKMEEKRKKARLDHLQHILRDTPATKHQLLVTHNPDLIQRTPNQKGGSA